MSDAPIDRRALVSALAPGAAALAGLAAAAGPAAAQAPARRGDGGVNVRDHGARGDGQSDDSRAFARAVETLGSAGGTVFVPPGTYRVAGLATGSGVWWQGVPGASVLRFAGGGRLLGFEGVRDATFSGLTFDGNRRAALAATALVEVWRGSTGIAFERCVFQHSAKHGLAIWEAGCEVRGCTVQDIEAYGIRIDSPHEVRILGNTLRRIDNNGIRIERGRAERVRTTVADNHIADIASTHGGDGPNGNAISIFRAHDVIVRGNHVSRCAFSAVRSNLGHATNIVGNHFAECAETTVFIEFGATGAVVVGNTIADGGGNGITVTNFNDDGRLATVVGNVVRNAGGYAIFVEADTLVQGNAVDGARIGIVAGQGAFLRNVTIDGNILQDRRAAGARKLAHGILVSNHAQAGPAFLTNNRIFDAADRPIWGHAFQKPAPLGGNVYMVGNHPGIDSRDVPPAALPGSTNYEPDTGLLRTYRGAGRRRGWQEA